MVYVYMYIYIYLHIHIVLIYHNNLKNEIMNLREKKEPHAKRWMEKRKGGK